MDSRQNRYSSLADRILSNLALHEKCWIWTRYLTKKGYGMMTIRKNGAPQGHWVHIVAFELFKETKIPDGMTLDHKCRRTACCNPEHLEIVPRPENTRRAARGRR